MWDTPAVCIPESRPLPESVLDAESDVPRRPLPSPHDFASISVLKSPTENDLRFVMLALSWLHENTTGASIPFNSQISYEFDIRVDGVLSMQSVYYFFSFCTLKWTFIIRRINDFLINGMTLKFIIIFAGYPAWTNRCTYFVGKLLFIIIITRVWLMNSLYLSTLFIIITIYNKLLMHLKILTKVSQL